MTKEEFWLEGEAAPWRSTLTGYYDLRGKCYTLGRSVTGRREARGDYPCIDLQYDMWCCGAYKSYIDAGDCIYAEVRHQPLKSRILELAKERDILVPTCGGAYVPAGVVLRADREKSSGGS
jgi:hypothetical protein